jgi:hypothetical protein
LRRGQGIGYRERSQQPPARPREIDYGLATPIALADEYILNTGTVDEALAAFGRIVERHIAA